MSPDARAVRRRQVLLGTAVLATAVALGSSALTPAAEPEPGPSRPVPDLGLWTARRLPEAVSDLVGAMRAPAEVEGVLGTADSCFVLEVGGQRLIADDTTTALVPASTQKLLTGAAALSALGPRHRFTTRVVTDGTRLWLVGGGDPLLMTGAYARFLQEDDLTRGQPATSVEALADAVAAAGLRRVHQVVGDPSRHDAPLTVPTWKPEYLTGGHVSRLRALTVNGGWSAWDPVKVPAADPAREAAAVLTRLLEERGVEVAGQPGVGEAPDRAEEVATVSSPPLARIVESLVRASDNTVAELLTRELGVAAGGEGTTLEGTAAVVDELDELGVPTEGVELVDGSGLDRGNRATCASVFGALALSRRDEFASLERGLSVAGRRGTMHDRMEGSAHEGRLRAKTGGLSGVTGLVGTYRGERSLRFAMLANGAFDTLGGYALQERVAGVLDRYPFALTDPDALAPN